MDQNNFRTLAFVVVLLSHVYSGSSNVELGLKSEWYTNKRSGSHLLLRDGKPSLWERIINNPALAYGSSLHDGRDMAFPLKFSSANAKALSSKRRRHHRRFLTSPKRIHEPIKAQNTKCALPGLCTYVIYSDVEKS
eukprot:jgi/Botrbrau1/12846/Bobra.0045s0015.1